MITSTNGDNDMIYLTIKDAKTALDNSGVAEMFFDNGFDSDEKWNEVHEFMWRNDVAPEQAAEHFKVI